MVTNKVYNNYTIDIHTIGAFVIMIILRVNLCVRDQDQQFKL